MTVYRLVAKGTVDRNIYDIAERKLKLDAAVMERMAVTGVHNATSVGIFAYNTYR